MLGAVHEYRMLILESHLDTFGHVNNAAYLQILEEARWDLITRNGYGLAEVHRLRIGPVILEVRLRFAKELRNRQAIVIRTWTESYSGKIGTLAQQILDESGEVCCDALFTFGLFDLEARRLIRPTPEWVSAIGLQPEDVAGSDGPGGEARP